MNLLRDLWAYRRLAWAVVRLGRNGNGPWWSPLDAVMDHWRGWRRAAVEARERAAMAKRVRAGVGSER